MKTLKCEAETIVNGNLNMNGREMLLTILLVIFLVTTVAVSAYYIPSNINLQNQVNSNQAEVSSLSSIVTLQNSTVVAGNEAVSQATGAYSDFTLSTNDAGYVSVYVNSASVSSVSIVVSYTSSASSPALNYKQAETVGVGGTAIFPLLPSTNIVIGIGNTQASPGPEVTEHVTITYYY